MKFLIFSDLDGTFMNHDNYCYGALKILVSKIKKNHQIIFNSSKTFSEIRKINEDLDINFPFIVENGACIFFPNNYLDLNLLNSNFHRHGDYFSYSLAKKKKSYWFENLYEIRKKFHFDFLFFRELSDKKIQHITGLDPKKINDTKKRLFSEPLLWNDTEKKLNIFEKELKLIGGSINIGGRFIHVTEGYDKGSAITEFMKIIEKNNNESFLSVSLGDSHNDLSMLELTEYSCIIKSPKKKKTLFKKKKKFIS